MLMCLRVYRKVKSERLVLHLVISAANIVVKHISSRSANGSSGSPQYITLPIHSNFARSIFMIKSCNTISVSVFV